MILDCKKQDHHRTSRCCECHCAIKIGDRFHFDTLRKESTCASCFKGRREESLWAAQYMKARSYGVKNAAYLNKD